MAEKNASRARFFSAETEVHRQFAAGQRNDL